MSEQKAGSTVNLVVATQEEELSFLTEPIDLKRVAKKLAQNSSKAVDILVEFLESKDERVRMQAAMKLLEFHVAVAKEISNDQMQRLIAEIKVARPVSGKHKLIEAGQGGPKKPMVDFTTIRTIED